MKIEIEVDEKLLEQPVREATMKAIYNVVNREVHNRVQKIEGQIETAVAVYLDKILTPDKMKSMIDSVTLDLVRDRLGVDL